MNRTLTHKAAKLLRTTLVVMTLFVGVVASTSTVEACPNCKDSVSDDSEMARLGRGYSTSVIFMLSVMGCLVAGFGGAAYFVVKKASAMPMPDQNSEQNSNLISGQGDLSELSGQAEQSKSSTSDDHIS